RVQLLGIGADDLQRRAPTDRWLTEVAAREKAQVAAQDTERPTQLVRRDAQELALRLARCPRLLRSLPSLDVGDERERGEGDEDVEDLQGDHLLEQGLAGKRPAVVNGRPDSDAGRDQCGGGRAPEPGTKRGQHAPGVGDGTGPE